MPMIMFLWMLAQANAHKLVAVIPMHFAPAVQLAEYTNVCAFQDTMVQEHQAIAIVSLSFNFVSLCMILFFCPGLIKKSRVKPLQTVIHRLVSSSHDHHQAGCISILGNCASVKGKTLFTILFLAFSTV